MRQCKITNGWVGDSETCAADGAYDLLDVSGTPEEIGKAIADSLRESDIMQGRDLLLADRGADIFLTVTIRISPVS